jgi:hypothetical protein
VEGENGEPYGLDRRNERSKQNGKSERRRDNYGQVVACRNVVLK